MSHDTTDEIKVVLSSELRSLVRESKEHSEFRLPESVEYAINDWRFWDVLKRLQEECDTMTMMLYEELNASSSGESSDKDDFNECVWLHQLLIKWKLLDEKFTTSGIQYPLAR